MSSLLKWFTSYFNVDSSVVKKASEYIESVHEFFQVHQLKDLFPYEVYDEETGMYDCATHTGFIVEITPLVGSSESLENDLNFLSSEVFEEGAYVQTLLWADPDISVQLDIWKNAREGNGDMLEKLAQRRHHHFSTALKEGRSFSPRNYRCFVSYGVGINPGNPLQHQQLALLKDRVVKVLDRHTKVSSVEPERLIQIVQSLVYPAFEKNDSYKKRWNPLSYLRDQMAPKGFHHRVSPDEIELNGTWTLKTYSVDQFPRVWSLGAMSQLIGDGYNEFARLNYPFYLHYGFYIPKQEKVQGSFQKKLMIVDHQSKSPQLMRLMPGFSEEVDDYNSARKALSKGEALIQSSFSVGIFAPKEGMMKEEQTVLGIFRNNRWKLEANRYTHLSHHLACLPLSWSPNHIEAFQKKGLTLKTGLSSEPSLVMPLQGEWQGTPSPAMVLMGRKGQLFQWSAFDNPAGNYNTIVVGSSGSGKSVFMQELLVSTLGIGGRVFVIDVGRSFERTCKILEGQFVEFTKHVDLCLNPFTKMGISEDEDLEDTFSMLKAIVAMMAAPTGKTDDFENALIEKALRDAWALKKQKATMTDVSTLLQSSSEERARRLGVMLIPYTKDGVYGRYFEGENNINFYKPMVVVELEELKERKDLQSVVLQIFMMTISNQMLLGDRKTPFHICFDEAWDLLRGEQTGVFIETLARRLRKYRGSLVVGTQSVNDFYKTPGSLATFENSDWMCLLSQKKESVDALKESGRLSMEGSMEVALKSVTTRHGEWSEVMIYNSTYGYAIGRLILDPFSVLLYSTQAHEYARIQQLVESGLSIEQAIDQMIEYRKKKREE
jgi:conjugal transfer ATP-binding protein TraC